MEVSIFFNVSIPIWCDYKDKFYSLFNPCIKVSIPIWCDYKASIRHNKSDIKTVSIPIWCDYKKVTALLQRTSSMFQFQYGAIISNVGFSCVP